MSLNRNVFVILTAILLTATAAAQQPPLSSPLLDHLLGHWVLRGEIAGKQTTHDVDADWVIQHHYLRLHEVSREKDAKGQPQYEATVFIGQSNTSSTTPAYGVSKPFGRVKLTCS